MWSEIILDDGRYNAFPGIARFPNGNLIVVYRAATGHLGNDGVINYKTSRNAGLTWSAPNLVYAAAAGHDATGADIALLSDNTFLVPFFEEANGTDWKVYVIKGTINGSVVTWGSRILANGSFGWSATGPSKPLQLANGHILLPIYVRNPSDTNDRAAVVKSMDGGLTWSSAIMVASSPGISYNEIGAVQLASGRVVLIIRNETLPGYSRVHSDDNGTTWSSPTNVINLGAGRTPGKPCLTILPSGDLLLITRVVGTNILGRTGYATSPDGGLTWTPFTNYDFDEAHVYAGSVALPDGKIASVIARERSATDAYLTFQTFGG